MAATLFKRHFGATAVHLVRAPGVLALLGDTADRNESLVVSVAVNKFVQMAATPRADGRVELVCAGYPGRESFWLSDLKPNPAAPWADVVKSLLGQLRRRGASLGGFNAAMVDEMASGAEMGGLAASATAAALTLRALFPFSLTELGLTVPPQRDANGKLPPIPPAEKLHFARLCRAAAATIPGAPVGLLGPVTSLLGKAWHVLSVDLRFITVERSPLIGEVIVVCRPGGTQGGELRERDLAVGRMERPESAGMSGPAVGASPGREDFVASCGSAARKLGAASLRSVELKLLEANRSRLTPEELACARHVVTENQRVVFAERALRSDDHRQLGEFMLQSYESARDRLKQSAPDVALLVELARVQPGCLGARACGSGADGATMNLVSYHRAEGFMRDLKQGYLQRTGRELECLVCQVVDGAG